MAKPSGNNKDPPENIILEATVKYVPRNPKIGLEFEKSCVFVLVRDHDLIKERKGLYFVYDIGHKYGFVEKRKMKQVDLGNGDWRAEMCKVIEKHDSQGPDKLSLDVGDIVKVIDRSPTGWYYGINKKGGRERRGWFSKHYIREQFEFEQNDTLTYQFTVQAVNSFQRNRTCDLEFSAKDYLDIIQRPNSSDINWLARNEEGKIGRIPKAQVDEKPELSSVLLRWPWYHPNKSKAEISDLMDGFLAEPHHFLVRDSESHPGYFTICVTKGNGQPPLNILAKTSATGYDVDNKQFDSLLEIINYYTTHAIYVKDGEHYFLLKVIQRED